MIVDATNRELEVDVCSVTKDQHGQLVLRQNGRLGSLLELKPFNSANDNMKIHKSYKTKVHNIVHFLLENSNEKNTIIRREDGF